MFGEERVNNSGDLLSRILVTFSDGQISALAAIILQVLEKTLFTTATSAREPDGTVMQPSGLLVLFMGRSELPHFCCNLLLQTLECYRTCKHPHLACFLFETNQHFVGSARIAVLFLTDEVG